MGCTAALARPAGEGDDDPNNDSHAHIAENAIVVEVKVVALLRVLLPVRGDESPATTVAEVFLWFVLVVDILGVLMVVISSRLMETADCRRPTADETKWRRRDGGGRGLPLLLVGTVQRRERWRRERAQTKKMCVEKTVCAGAATGNLAPAKRPLFRM